MPKLNVAFLNWAWVHSFYSLKRFLQMTFDDGVWNILSGAAYSTVCEVCLPNTGEVIVRMIGCNRAFV